MKYMQTGGFQHHPLMKLTLYMTLLFLSGFWVTNTLLYFGKMGLTPSSVISYYNGSEELFQVARTYRSMLEVTHSHLPMMAIIVLLLTHLLIFAPFKNKTKVSLIMVSFLSALLTEGSGWLVRFVNPHFAIFKIVGFLVFQCMLAFLIFALGRYLYTAPISTKSKKSG